jgi:hypothetical protein
MKIEVLHECGCIGPRSTTALANAARCIAHAQLSHVVGVQLLRQALGHSKSSWELAEGPRPSDTTPRGDI